MSEQGNLFARPCAACGRIEGHAAGCPFESQRPEQAPHEFAETKEAIQKAKDHANALWMDTAYSVGVMHARRFPKFSSADIDIAMQHDFPGVSTHEKRAMGAVIRRLMRERVVEKTTEIVQDPRRNCHNQNKRVLRSLLYRGMAHAV
jgi:hypothetical protein